MLYLQLLATTKSRHSRHYYKQIELTATWPLPAQGHKHLKSITVLRTSNWLRKQRLPACGAATVPDVAKQLSLLKAAVREVTIICIPQPTELLKAQKAAQNTT